MPSSVTAPLYEGTDTSLATLLKRCARIMGVFAANRDEPIDAPLPEQFTIDSYYTDRVDSAQTHLDDLLHQTTAQIVEEARREDARRRERNAERDELNTRRRGDYERVLAELDALGASALPEGLYRVAREQLTDSLNFDTSTEKQLDQFREQPISSPSAWHQDRVSDAHGALKRAHEALAAEATRVSERNIWLAKLRSTLKTLEA